MGCNCKKVRTLEDDYGVKEDETLLGRLYRYMWRVIIFLLLSAIVIITLPILCFVFIYKMVFSNNMSFVLPKFLRNKIKVTDNG